MPAKAGAEAEVPPDAVDLHGAARCQAEVWQSPSGRADGIEAVVGTIGGEERDVGNVAHAVVAGHPPRFAMRVWDSRRACRCRRRCWCCTYCADGGIAGAAAAAARSWWSPYAVKWLKILSPYWLSFQGCSGMYGRSETEGNCVAVVFQ